MFSFIKKIIYRDSGQVLPVVLALLALGGLVVAPAINYSATSIKSEKLIEQHTNGILAADCGVEYAFWCLTNAVSPPSQLPEYVNNMEVTLQVENKGTYTLYFGEFMQTGTHSNFLNVASDIVWVEGAQAYKYTITVTWQAEPGAPTIHIEEVGTLLPLNYSYLPGSAATFSDNLSVDEPSEVIDEHGKYLLKWELQSPYPNVSQNNPVETQGFYITGNGNQEEYYAWVVASREDIGSVGEITGPLYKVTSNAISPDDGKTVVQVIAWVMQWGGTVKIVSWQVIK